MSKIQNLDYAALTVSGNNYLQWALDTKIILRSKDLGNCIVEGNETSETDKYKAILIIRHHLCESLKNQYLTIENPLDLWTELKSRYDHQKTVLLPKARFDWKNLRIQDFKSVDEYNSALFKIVSILKLCGEEVSDNDLLEKTFSTFHTNNVVLQQTYREKGFKTYASLISCLLLAEQNNELLMMNSAMRPPGSAPLPETSKAVETKSESHYVQQDRYRGRSRGRWTGRGGHVHGRGTQQGGQGRGNRPGFFRGRGRGRGISKPPHTKKSGGCLRCGMDNHWAKTCRTPKYLIDLYQASLKKNPEVHMAYQDEEGDFNLENDDSMDYESSDLLKEDN